MARKRIIRTWEDAAAAIAELSPPGVSTHFDLSRRYLRDGCQETVSIEFSVWGFAPGRNVLRVTAHSAAEIVRKFISEFLPALRPDPPAPNLGGKQPLRLGYEPMEPVPGTGRN